jgi:DNA-binding response OmpR family regulator
MNPTLKPRPQSPQHVLVIDDNVDSANTLSDLFGLLGFSVSVHYDGRTGVAAALHERPDVVISDIAMQGVDGYEVARQLRPNIEGALIALSAFGQRHDRIKALEAGFDDHIVKPMELAALLSAIRRVRTSGNRPYPGDAPRRKTRSARARSWVASAVMSHAVDRI